MNELVFAAQDYESLVEKLLTEEVESCAVLYLTKASVTGTRLLCKEILFPDPEDYQDRSPMSAELSPSFVALLTKKAKTNGYSLGFVHTHPGPHPPEFSITDDFGEAQLASFLERRGLSQGNCALVISRGGSRARVLGTATYLSVISLGSQRSTISDQENLSPHIDLQFDRQVRAFGVAGQAALQKLRVAIVGLGGTGSVVAQQLAHLGVERFLLIDPDTIEVTNLNRVVGATVADVNAPKVEVAKRLITQINPSAIVEAVQGDVIYSRVAMLVSECDCVFGCTDSHGSRAVLQQLAYQFLMPCIDMGVTITARDGTITGAFGRVQLLSPGSGCFTCGSLLDPDQVRRDMMNEYERRSDPYIVGGGEPAPAVISINSATASFAVNMFLSVFIGLPFRGRQLVIDFLGSGVRVVTTPPRPKCHICSSTGALARGMSRRLSVRMD